MESKEKRSRGIPPLILKNVSDANCALSPVEEWYTPWITKLKKRLSANRISAWSAVLPAPTSVRQTR